MGVGLFTTHISKNIKKERDLLRDMRNVQQKGKVVM
jgi:hypothetical protein